MSISTPADLVQAKRIASGLHILHIDRAGKANGGPRKLTASILTHPASAAHHTRSQKSDEDEEEGEEEEGERRESTDTVAEDDLVNDMRLEPILDRRCALADSKQDFNVQDLFPDKAQRESLLNQAALIAVHALVDHVKGFKKHKYTDDARLRFPGKRPLPEGYRTRSMAVLSTLGDQINATRVVALIREAYTGKLHINEEQDLVKRAIPSVNDASINNLIRRTMVHDSTSDKDHALLSALQLAPGLNDILRKLVSQVIKVHCPKGLDSQYGLAPLFRVIGKAHLALGRPADFEGALSAIDTVVQSSLLNCWKINCGFDDLEAYAASNPSPDDILALAKKIVIKHAKRVVPKQPDHFPDDRQYSDGPISDLEGTKQEDKVYTAHRLMLRDTLYVVLLKRAICDADFGRVEDLLGVVGVYLLGADGEGLKSTAMEIMHFVYDLKYVWSEKFGNIMRDSMIASYFKQSGNAMPTDISLVNLGLYSKFFYESHGWSDQWHIPKTMDEAIALVDQFDQKLATKGITEKMGALGQEGEGDGDCCVM